MPCNLPLSELDHPNIVKIVGIVISPPCIVMEFISEGNLAQIIKTSSLLGKGVKYIKDIANGLAYLHNKHEISHGSIKPSSIMIHHHNGEYTAKLADFELARKVSNSYPNFAATTFKEAQYVAPELLNGHSSQCSFSSDMYSFALTSYDDFTND